MATNQQIKEHIAIYGPIIQELAKKNGYKVCSPIIAQSITETISSKDKSGWSLLKYKYHNFFGLKCGQAWLKAGKPGVCLKTGEEYMPGKIIQINDYFRVFASDRDGIQGYFDFISTNRYKNLKTATTPEQYLQLIKADGYCTSSTYYTTNMGWINKYNLKQYDTIYKEPSIGFISFPTLRKGMNDKQLESAFIFYWQVLLDKAGYNPGTHDGVFGQKTEKSVKLWQQAHGLVPDGIIGPKTWETIPD